MKFPYAVNRQVKIQCSIEYDEETEAQTSWTQQEFSVVSFPNCLEEKCGAFYDGRCHHKE